MIVINNIDLIEYKPLRTSPNMRLLLDVGELDSDTVKMLHEFRMAGNQKLTIILAYSDDLKGLKESIENTENIENENNEKNEEEKDE